MKSSGLLLIAIRDNSETEQVKWLDFTLGTTLCNATQAKRASQGFIGQAERSVLEEQNEM